MTQNNPPVSPLRQRMIDDMRLRKLSPKTQTAYIRGSLNATITGLKFFFEVTLQRPEAMAKMSHVYEPRTLPLILSLEEVTRRRRSHSTRCALIERHYSTGDVIVVLDSLTRALTATLALLNVMRPPEINTPLTRYRRSPRFNSSPDHTCTDHYPVSKSPSCTAATAPRRSSSAVSSPEACPSPASPSQPTPLVCGYLTAGV